ncbi:sugar ABC transporter permease, partial [Streptomyces sp. NRRL F-6602]
MTAAETQAADPPAAIPSAPLDKGTPPPAGTPSNSGPPRRKKGALLPYLLILPAIIAVAAVYAFPLVKSVIMSFQDMGRRELWSGNTPPWVGFDQYTAILADSEFWYVVGRTVLFMTVCVVLTMAIGLLLALLMMRL